ncbi:hypothetical protein D9757_015332 [Collybiopsis confluens]|uniref:DNase I-like protein n=1 Tax=Collybiopsis confluens TaxID=2823264 RepID=A0A8H5CED8_9AGAR|nr:hypothetical protein D9757_015332 [Collybiopsis confluens]
MVVGEAHLDNQRRDEIERIHGKHLRIFFSKLNNTPNAAGVAIVLNKAKTNVENVKTHEVVAGRALLLETRWHNSEKISILGIYAPNTSMRENGEFWEKINNFFERNPRISRPHVMLGDFNMVEEPIDRLPMRNDATIAVDALDNLKTTLQLEDGWRETYPNTLKYTFMRSARDSIKHHARLDRIYNRMDAREKLFEWKIETPGINTDHDLVSVQYTSESTPYTGRGRWVLPLHLLYDKHVKEFIQEEGQRLEERLQLLATEDIWDGQCNAQTEWAEFQINLRGIARERSKIVVPRLTREINILEGRIDSISNDPLLTEEERLLSTTVLKEQLSILEQRKHQSTRTITHARNMVYGETVSRYWSQQNKAKTPRQPIMRLIKNLSENQKEPINTEQGAQGQPNETPIYETQSLKMANMMMDHHNNLQQDEAVPDAESRERAIQATLNHVKICISDASKLKLEKLLTDADVEEALRLSANHKAPGLNGISYEITPWTKVLEKIDKSLTQWEKSRPTMEGRRLIISMIIGGMTQYLAKVQGMPKETEGKLEKRIKRFLWDEKQHTRINYQTIQAPIDTGGKQLLDIVARNEAIMVTWLQSYLDQSESRATWAYVADALLAHHVPQKFANTEERLRINMFLQSWKTKKDALPEDLKKMISVAEKFGTRVEGLAFSREIMWQMPIWYHSEAKQTLGIKNKECNCLRKNHHVQTVGDTETVAKKSNSPRHTRRRNCRCAACSQAREHNGCLTPYRCFAKARDLLHTLPQKWNPLTRQPEDYETEEMPPPRKKVELSLTPE